MDDEEVGREIRAANRAAARQYCRERAGQQGQHRAASDAVRRPHTEVRGGQGATDRARPYSEGVRRRARGVDDTRGSDGGGGARQRPKGRCKSRVEQRQENDGEQWAAEMRDAENN
jgi:hypothetical protein